MKARGPAAPFRDGPGIGRHRTGTRASRNWEGRSAGCAMWSVIGRLRRAGGLDEVGSEHRRGLADGALAVAAPMRGPAGVRFRSR